MVVVLLIADSLRADGPGFCGGEATTPRLDQLASEGTWSNHMFASGAWTIPSIMAMLTGEQPHRIGVARWRHPFPARRPNLLTAFRAAGFDVRCLHPYPRWGFLAVPGAGAVGDSQVPDDVAEALRTPRGTDRFVLIHHWWTHLPYLCQKLELPQWHAACDFSLESLGAHPARIAPVLEAAYRKSLEHLSEVLVDRYLSAASSHGQDVLFVLTSDHGENWGEALPPGRAVNNVYDLHGRWLADSTIRIPFLVWGKSPRGAIPGGRTLDGLMAGTSVAPTLAELAAIPWPGPLPDVTGCTVVDRGISPEGEGLEIPGTSLVANIFETSPTGLDSVLTVSSHNTHVPHAYPPSGKLLWRTVGLRTTDRWFVWDGVDQQGQVQSLTGGSVVPDARAEATFALLENERLRAVGAGPTIANEDLDAVRARAPGPTMTVEERLAALGYLD